jgi:hypothetical protein
MIVAQTLTDQDADDPSQVGPLLDQIDEPIAQVTADGAYDGAPTYQTIAAHNDNIEVVIPPRSTAVPSGDAGPPTQRDSHLAVIAEQGRLAWQATTGYGLRSLARLYRKYGALRPSLNVKDCFLLEDLAGSFEGEAESSEIAEGAPSSSRVGPVKQLEAI